MKHLLVIAAVLISGCTTVWQQADRDCQRIGYRPGTTQYAQCYRWQSQQRLRANQEAARAISRGGEALVNPYPQQAPQFCSMVPGPDGIYRRVCQ